MKPFLRLLAAPLLLAPMTEVRAAQAAAATPPAKKPNVLFILVDDMGWRDVGFMGSRYYRTPHIDRLAQSGFRFIMHTLEQLGIRDDTLVVFTSDNGGVMYAPITDNAPLRGGKGQPYEGGIRDPMVISWPGHLSPGQSALPMLSMDFYPTLLELCGVKQNTKVDGVSLVPVLHGKPAGSAIAAREAIFWHFPHYRPEPRGEIHGPNSIIRQGDWKLILLYEKAGKHSELYNLANDPGEKIDLASKEPARAQAMLARLEQWQKDVGAQLPERR